MKRRRTAETRQCRIWSSLHLLSARHARHRTAAASPDLAFRRRGEREYVRPGQPFARTEVHEFLAVVRGEPGVGAEPERAVCFLRDAVDDVAREPVFRGEARPAGAFEARRAAAPRAGPDRAVLRGVHREDVIAALRPSDAEAVGLRPGAPGLAVE